MKKYIKDFCLLCLGIALLVGSTRNVGASDEKNEELTEIVIGCDEYEPYNYFDKNGNLVGIDADLAEEAFNRMGYSPTHLVMKWTEKDDYLDEGVIDCIWDAYSMNGKEDKYLWSDPYLYSKEVVVVNDDSTIMKLDDLDERKIATLVNTRSESILLQEKLFPEIQVEAVYSFQDMKECLTALRQKYVEAATGDRMYMESYMKKHPGKLRILDESLETSRLGVAFSEDTDPELTEKLNRTLQEMRQDGTIDKILEKYQAKGMITAEGEDRE
ncbi:substrate-binding periplasmic protein [Blautia sp. MSJ-19]|uniref:substrate-binding periplasmic protein n=1 Tax=Blautia sp. MSJ-19 TaxID=2841517 RepID=UPI001C0EC0E2|nr:transporter substrate-binding domain-containing protein [Blautia sp. MSJ-19]MBU5479817.1 transporter substrate-binding domain-containing protein [Blautia sp. MSJ-19]